MRQPCQNYSNVNTKETEKLSNYKDLESGVSRMWKVRTKVAPFITGALGTVRKVLDQNLQSLPVHPSALGLQRITLMSTANIIRYVPLVPVPARSKASVYGRSSAGIVGSNPTGDMDVCLL